MKILVTGGGGFLGQAIVRQLLDRGDAVRVINRSDYPELARLGVDCRRGDLADAGAVDVAVAGVDAVIHVAAKAGPGLYAPDYEAANVTGTENVLQACRRHSVPYLVHTSSPSVVHGGGDIEGGDESLPYPTHFQAPYPETKARAERLVLAANGEGLKTCALRPHLIWGPGDNQLLPRLIEKNRAGRLRLPGPDKKIDTVYIDNAAAAHLLALDNLRGRASAAGKAYFISNGEPLAAGEIITRLLEAAGETPRLGTVSPRLAMAVAALVEGLWRLSRRRSDPPLSRFVVEHLSTAHWYDLSAARRDLGYEPAVSIEQGLERLRSSLAH
ncbi:NAD-dependent epimerase/dehydratase family protein [Wenzhouxiangella marina]|uniref:3-beta-hydroxysteroid dehydrogenase/isomerase family protein n=1 Tax=Wenzhouxiangella marina TaxID=1579979 RepID=A0A0K0XTD7_9GAMM|nr:NAD-dependent epimerase/dehydratase family protein [Wenzhouxiangella marina]AKS40887.1 3-beta-hydroxysteroid dehydrogenase/isomerase family protein [Wenzhouxiangella marina]MBB6087761.1 nucleoside-diphosphate-sugar epimerase [Wenzhouxiangella marina]